MLSKISLAKAFISVSVIAAASAIKLSYGFYLGILYIFFILWTTFSKQKPLKVKFGKLHNYPTFAKDTAVMLLNEWPSPEGNHGEPEHNFVRTSSLYESSDRFPCHLIALNTENQVIAHVSLSISTNSSSKSHEKYIKMLQRGVPLLAVKNSAKLAGLDTDFLDKPEIMTQIHTDTTKGPYEGYMSSLLVKPKFRGQGVGKAMCSYAVLVAKVLEIVRIVGGCSDKVLPFYQKMGVCRDKAAKREDVPSVRLGNSMYLDLDKDIIEKAKENLSKY